MSATGMVMRQALGTPPPTTDAAWLYSPDILVYPINQPSNTTLFAASALYGTAFVQAPAISAANYLYVRGQNANSGPQTSTVYLFSADHNPQASIFAPSPLLVPQQWQSANFTVNGKAQNSVSIQASAQSDIVLGAAPLVWTPPPMAHASYDHYCLIAWVDNTGHNPPPFSTLPNFGSMDLLRQYVEANPNMVILDTAYTSGMFMRQYMGQEFNQAQQTNTPWQSSPDIVVSAGNVLFDPTLIPSALGWAFHQMPLPTQSNYLYVRGYNYSTAAATTRVSFYYAEDNPTAGTNPLLNPQNWKTDSFTYSGVAQNHFDLTVASPFLLMTNSTPLIWTPAAPDSGSQYCVIAWVDNTDGLNPPPFATLAPFTDINALGEYIEGQRNMVLWDTAVNGLFARQFPGQTVYQPGTGAQTSPDIIVNGPQAAQDASSFATQSSYNSTTLNQGLTLGERSFIYLRVINPNNIQQSARVYLYYATSTAVSPTEWTNQGFTVAGKNQNWVDLEADTLNQVLVTTVPVVWTAPPQGQYILIAYVDGSENPQPPDFSPFGYTEAAPITQLLATQPQIAWLSLNSTAPSQAPTMSYEYPLPTPAAATQQYVGIQFQNIPADGTVSISIPGPDAANTIVNASMHIPDPNAVVVWPVSYPANFQNSILLNYWQGSTAPPNKDKANIIKIVLKSSP